MKPSPPDEIMAFPGANAWVRAAALCHFNISPLLMRAGLHVDSGGLHHISRQGMIDLMMQCVAHAAPTHHFPLIAGEAFAFDTVPSIETFLAASPTVRQAMPALEWVSVMLQGLTVQFQEDHKQAAILIRLDLRDGDTRKAAGYFVELVVAGIAKFVRMVLGGQALVERVELMHDPGPLRRICEMQFGAPIHVNQTRNAVILHADMLDRKLPGGLPDFHKQLQDIISQQLSDSAVIGPAEQIVRLFKRNPKLMGQGIQKVADLLHLHPRTLQRRLKEEGQVFGDIQTRCRHDHAIAQLKDSRIDIDALSEAMGFTNRTSFTRAFKDWTGMTPRDYRQHYLAAAAQPRGTAPNESDGG